MTPEPDPKMVLPAPAQAMEKLRPTSFEVATCAILGYDTQPLRFEPSDPDPMKALEKALLPALMRPPCVVAFSGGRDSSALLATAMDLARREGLPQPIALTRRWPTYPETDEDNWQELVIRHLGVSQWERVDFEDNDVIGAAFRPTLQRHGVLWPPLVHSWPPLFAKARGGAMVTGEGGDEVFGPRRCTWLRRLLWTRPRATKAVAIGAGVAVAPRSVRRRMELQQIRHDLDSPWLRPAVREHYFTLYADELVQEPFSWAPSLRWHLGRRFVSVGIQTLRLLAAESGTELFCPLLDSGFVASLASLAGPLGFPGRTRGMTALFGNLLPAELLSRPTKAYTTSALAGQASKDFAEGWAGDGLDGSLVDPAELQRTWASGKVPSRTAMLLQQAWLGTAGRAR